MRKQDMGNQFSKKTRKKAGSIQAQRIFRSRWFKSLVAMGSAVVFFTVYSLIIPAATLTEDQAATDNGIVLEEPAPSEPQVVETEEAPAPEPAPEDAPKEEPVAQAAVEETPAAASEETAAQTPAEETGTAPSTEQGTSESAAAGSGSEVTKETGTTDDAPADTADLNQTASAVDTTKTASDGIKTEEADAALTEEETAEDATTESSEESAEETSEEEEEIGTISELKAASGNLEALVRFADGAGIPENASLVIYGAGADTGKVQDALWSGSMDSIEQSSITTDLSEYVSFAVKDADGNDITPDSDCSIEISFGSEANLSDPGENRIRKYGSLVVSSDGNVSVTGTDLSTGNGHTYATFTGTLSGNTFGFAVTTADRKVNYLESLSGKTSDGAVEAALSFGKDAKVPEGSSLTVETASVNESSVLDKFWGDEEGVNRDTAKADDIRFVKFVIRDRNGNEVRPETKVSVKLTFHHEADLSEAAEGFVKKHNALAEGPDGTITLGSGALSAGNGITTVSFADVSAKSAFGYAVTTAEKKIVYATKLTGKSEDGSIEASLRLTEEAKIPEGSLLKVTPVTGESVQKTLLDNIWTDTSIIDPDTIKLTDSGLATVTITDKDGKVRKPEADAVLTLTFNKKADLAEAARKMVKRARAVEMTEENVKLSDSGLSVAEGKTRISYTGIVDGQTFGYAVSTAKQKTNFLDGKLSYEGEDYTIEVSVSKDNQIPENSKLNVKELDKDSEEFKKKLDQATEAVQKDAEKKSSDDIETSVDDASVRMFDITILNEDGDEIQPNGNVRVSVQYKNAVKVGADAKMKAVHFDEKNDEVQVLTPETKADTSNTEKKVHEVRFDANGFSVYAILGTQETLSSVVLPIGGNGDYKVTISYDSKEVSNIPDNVTVSVKTIDEQSSYYSSAEDLTAKALKAEDENFDADSLRMGVISLSIKDSEGNKITPDGKVKVTIEAKKVNETWSYVDVAEIPANTSTEDGEVDLAATIVSEKNVVEDGKATAEFETGKLESAYAIFTEVNKTTITATASDGANVEITGVLPEGAEASITPVTLSDEELNSYFGSDVVAGIDKLVVYDISILVGGSEWEPDKTVSVVVKNPQVAPVSDEKAEEVEQKDVEDVIAASHLTEEVDTKTAETLETKEDTAADEVAFDTDSFSLYGFYTYTVDYYYQEEEYHQAGGTATTLSKLFSELKIDHSINEVQEVSFSNPDLLKVEQGENDWTLTSLKPFDTEEKLTITLKDGTVIEIGVKDIYVTGIPDYTEPSWVVKQGNASTYTSFLPYATAGITLTDWKINQFTTTNEDKLFLRGDNISLKYDNVPAKSEVTLNVIGTITYHNGATFHDGTQGDVVVEISNFIIENTSNNAANFNTSVVRYNYSNDKLLWEFGPSNPFTLKFDTKIKITHPDTQSSIDETMIFGISDIDQPGFAYRDFYKLESGTTSAKLVSGVNYRYFASIPLDNSNITLKDADGKFLYYESEASTSITTTETQFPVHAKYINFDPNYEYNASNAYYSLKPMDFSESITIRSGDRSKIYVRENSPLFFSNAYSESGKRITATQGDGDPGPNTAFMVLADTDDFKYTLSESGGMGVRILPSYFCNLIKSSTSNGGSIETYDDNISGEHITYGPNILSVGKHKDATYYMAPDPFYSAKTIKIWDQLIEGNPAKTTIEPKLTVDVSQLEWFDTAEGQETSYSGYKFKKNGGVISYTFENVDEDHTILVEWERIKYVDSIVLTKRWFDVSNNISGTRSNVTFHLIAKKDNSVKEFVTGKDINYESNTTQWTKKANDWTYTIAIPDGWKDAKFTVYEDPVTDYSGSNYVEKPLSIDHIEEKVNTDGIKVSIGYATITNVLNDGELSFTKVNENNQFLQGASFALYTNPTELTPLVLNDYAVTAESNDKGLVKFSNIPAGTYYLKEIISPDGYKENNNIYTVTIHASDENQSNSMSYYGTYNNITGELTGSNGSYSIKNIPIDVQIKLEKHDSTNGNKIQGAQFKLFKYNDSNVKEELKFSTTNNKGEIDFGLLKPGKYEIEEIKPADGYIINTSKSFTFTILSIADNNNKLVVRNDNSTLVQLVNGFSESTNNGQVICTIITVNTPGTALPSTGGPGTTIYTLGGLLLVLGAGLMYGFVLRQKKRERRLR